MHFSKPPFLLLRHISSSIKFTCRHADNLPKTFKSLTFLSEFLDKDSDYIQENNPICFHFLWSPLESLLDTQDLTAVSPEDLVIVSREFQSPVLEKLWSNLLCPARLVLRQILQEEAVPGLQSYRRKWIDIPRVVPQSRFAHLFGRLLDLQRK